MVEADFGRAEARSCQLEKLDNIHEKHFAVSHNQDVETRKQRPKYGFNA